MPYVTLRICCSLLASKTVMHSCKSVFLKLCESTVSLFASSVFMQLLNWQQLSFSGGGKLELCVITGYMCLWTLSCVQQLKASSCSLPNTNTDSNYSLLCTLLSSGRTLPGPFASPRRAGCLQFEKHCCKPNRSMRLYLRAAVNRELLSLQIRCTVCFVKAFHALATFFLALDFY